MEEVLLVVMVAVIVALMSDDSQGPGSGRSLIVFYVFCHKTKSRDRRTDRATGGRTIPLKELRFTIKKDYMQGKKVPQGYNDASGCINGWMDGLMDGGMEG